MAGMFLREGWKYVTGLLLAGFAGAVLALFVADRGIKAWRRARRRNVMRTRLAAAAVRAEEQQAQKQESVQASRALTSVIPAIQRPPLTIPGVSPRRARPRNRSENTGPQAAHPRRRSGRTGEHHTRPADRAKRR
jgi:hypothetical protein